MLLGLCGAEDGAAPEAAHRPTLSSLGFADPQSWDCPFLHCGGEQGSS